MSRSSIALSLLAVERRLLSSVPPLRAKRLACVVSGITFMALPMAASAPAFAAVDWSGCLHAADPDVRALACTSIIGGTADHKTLLRALNGRGNALCATADRCREAVPDFASVVKLAPDVAGYHDNLARALRAAQRYPKALQESDRAIGLAPKFAFVDVGKARTLVAAGRDAEALAVVQVAMAVAPVDAGLLEYQGKLLGDLKRYPESYAVFARALQMQPTRMSVYVRRADAEAAEGRTAAAIGDLEHYPLDGAEAVQVRGKLDVLRASSAREAAGPASASDILSKQRAEPERKSEMMPKSNAPLSTVDLNVAAPVPTISKTCNLYEWQPLQRCIEDYHNENDPLPGGLPNPRRWNDELAAHGRSLVEQHPDITWDKTAWNKLAEAVTPAEKEQAQFAASAQLENGSQRRDPPQVVSEDATALTGSNEVEKCNDAQVLSTMLSDVEKFKKAFRDRDAASTPTAKGKVMLQIIDKWQVSAHNIRQQSFDATNNVRYCAADYQYNFQLPFELALVSIGLPGEKGICANAVTYKIEKTLDDPGSFYVTHYCR